MTEIRLRQATSADAEMLYGWQEQPYLQEVLGDDDWQWYEELAKQPTWREQLIAELNGQPIGYMEIIDPALEESHYWGDCEQDLRALDIWIGVPALLGKGYGTQMMQLALQRCFSVPEVKGVLLDPLGSNTRAQRFYQQFGFKFLEQRIFAEDVCFVFYLAREDYKQGV